MASPGRVFGRLMDLGGRAAAPANEYGAPQEDDAMGEEKGDGTFDGLPDLNEAGEVQPAPLPAADAAQTDAVDHGVPQAHPPRFDA